MGFGDAIRICLRKYVDFTGRAPRAEYWWFGLFGLIVGIGASLLDRILLGDYVAEHGRGPIGVITSLGLLLPSLAVFVRRLHDLDRTGWWALVFYGGLLVLIFCMFATL